MAGCLFCFNPLEPNVNATFKSQFLFVEFTLLSSGSSCSSFRSGSQEFAEFFSLLFLFHLGFYGLLKLEELIILITLIM